MTAKKIPVVRYEPALISEEDCEPRIGFIPFQDGDWVSFADYEAAITQMKSVTEYALSLEKLIDWDEMAQHYGVSVAKHNLGKRPTPRRPQLSDGVKSTKE